MAKRDFYDELVQLEEQIEEEVRQARRRWHYRLVRGRVHFARGARQAQRRFRQSLPRFLREARLRHLLAIPMIYSLAVPFALLDLWVSLYQWTCFPLFGIALVRRARYVVIDRHHLGYLNAIEKWHCVYCGYANGVLAYSREVAGRTEQFWCPIRHATRVTAPHAQYRRFVDYGDAAGYRARLLPLRRELGADPRDSGRPGK